MAQLTTDHLLSVLETAWDPDSGEWSLMSLPLQHLDVWEAVATRPRVPRQVREKLCDVARRGSWMMDGRRENETHDEFEVRYALTVASTRWLTARRLDGLRSRLVAAASVAMRDGRPDKVKELMGTLARHPHMTLPLMSAFLDGMDPSRHRPELWTHAVATLAEMGGTWALLAEVATHLRQQGQPWLIAGAGAALEGIDELSGRILVGMLPTWRGTLAEAVAAARDVADNPDPAHLAVDFGGYLDAESAPAAVAFATGPDTSREQLKRLPLSYLGIWSRVAARDDLDANLRKALMDTACEGPSRMVFSVAGGGRSARATFWARHVLAPAWLTGHRLKKLAIIAAYSGADPAVLVDLLVRHPHVTGDAITSTLGELWRGDRPTTGERSATEIAIEALSGHPDAGPWAALGPVVNMMRVPRRDVPEWWTELIHWKDAGRKLDELKLATSHLERLLRRLPTWAGELPIYETSVP